MLTEWLADRADAPTKRRSPTSWWAWTSKPSAHTRCAARASLPCPSSRPWREALPPGNEHWTDTAVELPDLLLTWSATREARASLTARAETRCQGAGPALHGRGLQAHPRCRASSTERASPTPTAPGSTGSSCASLRDGCTPISRRPSRSTRRGTSATGATLDPERSRRSAARSMPHRQRSTTRSRSLVDHARAHPQLAAATSPSRRPARPPRRTCWRCCAPPNATRGTSGSWTARRCVPGPRPVLDGRRAPVPARRALRGRGGASRRALATGAR